MKPPLITWLYAPASRPDRILKAIEFQPDAIIYDLEDAVAPPDKVQARRNLAAALAELDARPERLARPHLEVRINPLGSEYCADDLAMVRDTPAIRSVRVPKVDTAEDLDRVAAQLPAGVVIHALIETAVGVMNLPDICRSPHVSGVSLGEADLRAELRVTGTEVIDHIRRHLVISSAAAAKHTPMGSAFLNIHDHDGLLADTRTLARTGFLGRTALHPGQLPYIRAGFRPTELEHAAALSVLDAVGGEADGAASGAAALADGTFIDRPVILRAQQTVDLWEATQELHAG